MWSNPFPLRELISRIRAQLRRCYGSLSTTAEIITIGDISINKAKVELRKQDIVTILTPVEYKILLALAAHADMPLSRERLIEEVWGHDFFLADERTVDVHIRHLREKLEEEPSSPVLIQTVRGFGSCLIIVVKKRSVDITNNNRTVDLIFKACYDVPGGGMGINAEL